MCEFEEAREICEDEIAEALKLLRGAKKLAKARRKGSIDLVLWNVQQIQSCEVKSAWFNK